MYKKILVPLDGSKLAECSLSHVKAIAEGCHVSEVDLITIINPTALWVLGSERLDFPSETIRRVEEKDESAANDYLDKMIQDLKKEGITAISAVLRGDPASAILGYARENGVDLIILTTHGRSGPARWVLGSVAERVTKHANMPVIVVTPSGCVS